MENINCPECGKKMEKHFWTQKYDVCTCYDCKVRKYWDKAEQRFATHKEVNDIKQVWE